MIIDMPRYVRLGDQRLVFDDWLGEVGLIGRNLIEIRLGEGIHQCTGYVRGEHGVLRVRGDVITNDDGTTTDEREIETTTFGWSGPLPPASVLKRLQEIEREGIE